MAQNKNNEATLRRMARIAEIIKDQELLHKIGLQFAQHVRIRTQKGIDVKGHSFRPYSDRYAKKRSKAGQPTHPVNLTMDHKTGMLSKIDHFVFKDLSGLQAYISDPEKAQIGRYHHIEGAGKSRVIRQFWGLTDKQIELIRNEIKKDLDELFKENL